jgi:hypothetical protein
MDEIISARWATTKEVEDFYKWASQKNKSKNDFTSKWLADNGEMFIKLHKSYPDDYYNQKKQYYADLSVDRYESYKHQIREYNYKKENLGRCACFGNERIVTGHSYEFIGCDNWQSSGYTHTKINKPTWHENREEDLHHWCTFNPSPSYITQLRLFYGLPKELKPSILAEYLLMKNEELYHDGVKQGQNVGVSSATDSKMRERLVKSILDAKFEKVFHQKMIKAELKYTGKKTFIPDFICVKNDSLYLIEQKKRADLIDEQQINNYLQCLKLLASREYDLKYFVIVEFGETDLYNNIVNFKDLSTYEFI